MTIEIHRDPGGAARLCRRRDRGRPPRRRRGVACRSPRGCRPRRRMAAQAEAIHARYGAVASEPVPARFELDQLTRKHAAHGGGGRRRRARGLSGRRRRRLWRTVHRRRRRAASTSIRRRRSMPQGLCGRGAPSGRGHRRRAAASGAMAVEAPRLRAASAAARAERIEAGRRPPAAGPVRPAAFFMYEDVRRAFHHLLCTHRRAADRHALSRGERFSAFYLGHQSVAYIVSGPGDRERLLQVAQAAYDQIDKGVPAKPTW